MKGRMLTFEKIDGDHYKFSDSGIWELGAGDSLSIPTATLDEIRKIIRNPEPLDLVPVPEK